MSGIYNYATKYMVNAHCDSPLRTGSADGGADDVLRDFEGKPFIQGTSLAGAMREWINHSPYSDLETSLFECGKVIVSDGIFCNSDEGIIQATLRPRLKINGNTGSSANGAKFSISAVPAGCSFTFSIIMLEEESDLRMQQALEQVLSAINSGFITLGAQKTNGYGKVSLSVKKRNYDLKNISDMNAWIENSDAIDCFNLPKLEAFDRVIFTVTGILPNVLVKSEESRTDRGNKITVNIAENGRAIIPGSSIKGAIRSRVKAIADVLVPGSGDETSSSIFGTDAGDTGIPGKIYVSDAVIGDSKPVTVKRIKINKFTGGVFRNALFSEEAQSGNVKFTVSAPESNFICALIFFALRDLCAGAYNLGSGNNIGRGYISCGSIQINVPGNKDINMSFDDSGKGMLSDPDGITDIWTKSLGGESNA